jgi:hypothetical protein
MSSASARAARAHGEAFEAALDAYHAQLARQDLTCVRRVGTPTRVLGPVRPDARGRSCFRACFAGPQGVDFVGHLGDGRAVLIEAKSHAGPGGWDSGIDAHARSVGAPGGLGPEQWGQLRDAERCGAVALIVLSFGAAGARTFTPAELVEHVGSECRRTVRPADDLGVVGWHWHARVSRPATLAASGSGGHER